MTQQAKYSSPQDDSIAARCTSYICSNSMPFVYSFGLPASLFVDASQKPSFCRNSINHSQTPTFYTYHQNEAYSFLYSLLMINANFYHAQKSIGSIALPFASTE